MRKVFFDIETKNTFRDVGKADPALLDIAVVATFDTETEELRAFTEENLTELWGVIEQADILVGYNSDHFDIPLLNKYYLGDLGNLRSLDLMKEVSKSLGRKISLDTLVAATLGKKKTGSGLQSVEWWANGEYEKVKEYCKDDVMLTKELYDFILKNRYVKYIDSGFVKMIDVDTAGWETKLDQSMTRSLF